MTKLTIDITEADHRQIKAMAFNAGMTIKDFLLDKAGLLKPKKKEFKFTAFKIDTRGFKFNRDEANER